MDIIRLPPTYPNTVQYLYDLYPYDNSSSDPLFPGINLMEVISLALGRTTKNGSGA